MPHGKFTDEEWEQIMTLPTECCEEHGEECGYCFNCPVLPEGKGGLAYINRVLSPCKDTATGRDTAGEGATDDKGR